MTEEKAIRIRNIYYLLAYAFKAPLPKDMSPVAGEEFGHLFDFLAHRLAVAVGDLIKRGLHSEYVQHREACDELRGQLMLEETLRLRAEGDYQALFCRYSRLTVDNVLNRLLKTTMLVLLAKDEVKVARRNELRRLLARFGEVSELPHAHTVWRTLQLTRQTHRYREALGLCWLVSQAMLPATGEGSHYLPELSERTMHELYECFVREFYKVHYPVLKPTAAHVDWAMSEPSSSIRFLPSLRTDVLLENGDKALIIDTKFYANVFQRYHGVEKYHSVNLNQIYVYADNYRGTHPGCKVSGMLLYAKPHGADIPDSDYTMQKFRMQVRCLDLDAPFADIAAALHAAVATCFDTAPQNAWWLDKAAL